MGRAYASVLALGLASCLAAAACLVTTGCASPIASASDARDAGAPVLFGVTAEVARAPFAPEEGVACELPNKLAATAQGASTDRARAKLNLQEDFRAGFGHGPKPAEFQRYIMLHDTEGAGDAASVIGWWDSSGAGVAAHFVVNKDGSVVQCVPLDEIAHHAGFGDAGHNQRYGVVDESRDDKAGTTPVGAWAPDYGMNSYSIGIELVHIGGEGDYPAAQLQALDDLIAYIDAYYGFESEIIDHKAWRTGNSDTSPEFAEYFANYRDHRSHDVV